MRNRIIAHLSADCPTTLEDWDKVAYLTESNLSDGTSSQSNTEKSDYLTKDFFPDPVPFITLARGCDLPAMFATLLYLLCQNSTAQKQKVSRMTKGDLETLLLGKDRMMKFISVPAAAQLEIESWIADPYDYNYCRDESCHPPIFKMWSTLLQDVMWYGDPLATFRMMALEFRKEVSDSVDNGTHGYNYGGRREEICIWCKDRMADKLDALRRDLFDQLPSFFALEESDLQEMQD